MELTRQAGAVLSAAAGLPVGAAALALRPHWRVGLAERLGGLVGSVKPNGVWLHGASVGEALASTRLASVLQRRGHTVFVSAVTTSGRGVLSQALPDSQVGLAPLDHPWCVDRALARVQPRMLVLIETELWPTWIKAAKRRGVPVVIASARISDRSYPGYTRFRAWLGATFVRLDAVGARSDLDAERFVALGVPRSRVLVTGDLKLDPGGEPGPLEASLAAALPDVPLIVAGSTHTGEELAAAEALSACVREQLAAALVVAPRHLDRSDEVVRELEARGHSVHRRSALPAAGVAAGEVLVLDTLGELASLYRRATVAFVGGTLADIGGHNLLEPAIVGRPVLFGPSTGSVRDAVTLLEACGAGQCVGDARALAQAVVERVRDPAAAGVEGRRGQQAVASAHGSVDRTVALLERTLSQAAIDAERA